MASPTTMQPSRIFIHQSEQYGSLIFLLSLLSKAEHLLAIFQISQDTLFWLFMFCIHLYRYFNTLKKLHFIQNANLGMELHALSFIHQEYDKYPSFQLLLHEPKMLSISNYCNSLLTSLCASNVSYSPMTRQQPNNIQYY